MSQQEETQVNESGGGEIEPPPQLQPDAGNAPPIETGAGQIPPVQGPPAEGPPAEGPPILRDDDGAGGEFWARASLPNENETATTRRNMEEEKAVVLPIYIYTAIFGVIFLLGPLLVRRGPNIGITRCCIMLSAFCCWIFWVTTYIVQLNPLLGPRLGNETLAWIGYKWGLNPSVVPDDDSSSKANNTTTSLLMRRSYYDTNLASNLTAVVND